MADVQSLREELRVAVKKIDGLRREIECLKKSNSILSSDNKCLINECKRRQESIDELCGYSEQYNDEILDEE